MPIDVFMFETCLVEKHPDSEMDYQLNWETWLDGGGTLSDVAWTCDDGLTIESSSFTDTTATVIVSGGTLGVQYDLTCTITRSGIPEVIETFTITIYITQKA